MFPLSRDFHEQQRRGRSLTLRPSRHGASESCLPSVNSMPAFSNALRIAGRCHSGILSNALELSSH
jgi:hypothetical protein